MIERLKFLLTTIGTFAVKILIAAIYTPLYITAFSISVCLVPLDIFIWLFTGKTPFCRLFKIVDIQITTNRQPKVYSKA